MSQSVKYVGLDVHKDTIAVAVAEGGKRSKVREHGAWLFAMEPIELLLGPRALRSGRSPQPSLSVRNVQWSSAAKAMRSVLSRSISSCTLALGTIVRVAISATVRPSP